MNINLFIIIEKTLSKLIASFLVPKQGFYRARCKLACPGLAKTCHWQLFGHSVARISLHLSANPFESLQTKNRERTRGFLVPKQGFEPRFSGPEPDVLPLDDLGSRSENTSFLNFCQRASTI